MCSEYFTLVPFATCHCDCFITFYVNVETELIIFYKFICMAEYFI